ncbi:hypothetical protein ABK040_010914 [Willaertia magna]
MNKPLLFCISVFYVVTLVSAVVNRNYKVRAVENVVQTNKPVESYQFKVDLEGGRSLDVVMTFNNTKLSFLATSMFDKYFAEEGGSSIIDYRYLKNCIIAQSPLLLTVGSSDLKLKVIDPHDSSAVNEFLLQRQQVDLQERVDALQKEVLILRNAISLFLNENTNKASYDKGARIYRGQRNNVNYNNYYYFNFYNVPCYDLLIHPNPTVVPTSSCPLQNYGSYLTIAFPFSLKASKIVIKAKRRTETQCSSFSQLPDLSLSTAYSVNDLVIAGVSRTFFTTNDGHYYQELRATDTTKPFEGTYFHITTDGSSSSQKVPCFDLMKIEVY